MITNGRHSLEKSPQTASDGRPPGLRGRSAYPETAAEGRPGRLRGGNSVPAGFYEASDSFRRALRPPQSPSGPGGRAGRRPEAAGQPILSKLTLIISLGLHLLLILFLAFGLPSCQDKSGLQPEQVITVQLMEDPSPPPPPPAAPAQETREQPPAPEQRKPPDFEMPLGDSSRNLQRSGQAEAEAAEELAPPPPPEDLIALAPKTKAPPPELEKRRDRKPEVKPPEVKRRAEPKPEEPDYSQVPQSIYRTLGRDAGAAHFGSRQGRRADPVVSRYFELALRKVNDYWTAPKSISPRLVVGIALTIEPNGRISSVRITQPSGSAEYDRSVERAVKAASPLAPLPPVFGGQRISQVFYFTPDALGRRR